MIHINIFTKQKQTHRLKRQTRFPRGKCGRGTINWELKSDMYTLTFLG